MRRLPIRYLAVVDGEHYPPVVTTALESLQEAGHEVMAAILVGGREKLPAEGLDAYGDVPVRTGEDAREALVAAIRELHPDEVVDLSDEPVLDYRRRHSLAAVSLFEGVRYTGPDFAFEPPPRPRLCRAPSLAVIGTGKRTGKTAVAGFAARALKGAGRNPVVVAMGRGGPPEPEVLRGDELELTPADLLALADEGKHAASDYVEDAMLGRVPTIGCRRCGGGLAGGVEHSNVPEGVGFANDLDPGIILLEGSGSSLPPVAADATCLIVPANVPEEYLAGYFGTYRMLLADFAIVTMAEEPFGTTSQISAVTSLLQDSFRTGGERRESIQVVRTVFRPAPTSDVRDARAFVATTAPASAGGSIKQWLEEEHGCEVTGISHSLSDRAKLRSELEAVERSGTDVLICEIKAAGVDVATRAGLEAGLDVVYMDNVPVGIDGDDPEELILRAAESATERFGKSR